MYQKCKYYLHTKTFLTISDSFCTIFFSESEPFSSTFLVLIGLFIGYVLKAKLCLFS